MPRSITVDGHSYRVCGSVGSDNALAVIDEACGIGRMLVRDSADGPWRLWSAEDYRRRMVELRRRQEEGTV